MIDKSAEGSPEKIVTPEQRDEAKAALDTSKKQDLFDAWAESADGSEVVSSADVLAQVIQTISENIDSLDKNSILQQIDVDIAPLMPGSENVTISPPEDSDQPEDPSQDNPTPQEIEGEFTRTETVPDPVVDFAEKLKKENSKQLTQHDDSADTSKAQLHKDVTNTMDAVYGPSKPEKKDEVPLDGEILPSEEENKEEGPEEVVIIEGTSSRVERGNESNTEKTSEEQETEDESNPDKHPHDLNKVPHRKSMFLKTEVWAAPEGLNKEDFNNLYPLGPNEKARADAFWAHIEELRKEHGYDKAMEIIGKEYRLGGENVEELANRMNKNPKLKFPEKSIDSSRSIKDVQEDMLSSFFVMTPYMKDRMIAMPERAAAYAAISAGKKYNEYEDNKREMVTAELEILQRTKPKASPEVKQKIKELKELDEFHQNHEMFKELGQSIVRFNDAQDKLNKLGNRPIRNWLPFFGLDSYAAHKELRFAQMSFDIQNQKRLIDKQDWDDKEKKSAKKKYERRRRMWNGAQDFTSNVCSGAFATGGIGFIIGKLFGGIDKSMNWLRKQSDGFNEFKKKGFIGTLKGWFSEGAPKR